MSTGETEAIFGAFGKKSFFINDLIAKDKGIARASVDNFASFGGILSTPVAFLGSKFFNSFLTSDGVVRKEILLSFG